MKIRFHYRPEGIDPRSWEFAPKKMSNADAELIEDLTDLTFIEWQDKVLRGSVKALRVLLFVMLKRDTPSLRLDEVAFTISEVELEWFDDDEEPAGDPVDDGEGDGPKDQPNE